MAAARSTSQGEDSSSGDEDLERFREAAWEPPGSVKKTVTFLEESASPGVPSLRIRPDRCEHYENELQTTPEFRSHVAKKLAAILDSCIKEIPGNTPFHQESTAASDSEDEGFRLLTTSVPGDSGKILPSLPSKRRVASSTSDDSEEEKEKRCREAAVSGLDILKHSALQTTPVEIMDTASNNQAKKKKKKKRKMERRQNDETDDQNMEPEGKMNGFKKKRKKKDRRISDETQSYDQNMESEGKMNGCEKKKKKERVITAETQFEDQTIHPEPEKQSKKNKTGSDHHNKSETVKDLSKKENKEMGLSGTASDHNTNSMCGKSGTKKKKKKVIVEN